MDYTPQQSNTKPNAPSPTYELVQDASKLPPIRRGPQTLKDTRGREFKVPFPPNNKCKKCYGRGFIGINVKTNEVVICKRCYPML